MGSTLDAFIGGRSRSVVTLDLGPVTVAGVKLDPRALRWLIGTSRIEFGDATLTLRDLQRATLLELEDVIAHAGEKLEHIASPWRPRVSFTASGPSFRCARRSKRRAEVHPRGGGRQARAPEGRAPSP